MKDISNKSLKEQAWIGDAVLSLYAREWILKKEKKMDAEIFSRMTSNHFLNSLGNPTKIEAGIGETYDREGLEQAFFYIEQKILPLYLKQEKKRIRQAGGKR